MRVVVIIGLWWVFFTASAQIPRGGSPLLPPDYQSLSIPFITPDTGPKRAALKDEAIKEINQAKKPLKIGVNTETDLGPGNAGQWMTIDGKKVWRLEIWSPGAFAVNAFFSRFALLPGSKLFIYDPERTVVLGGFNHLNNKKAGVLPTGYVPGDRLVIELQVSDRHNYGELQLGSVSHAFVDVFGINEKKDSYYGLSGYCNVDINCNQGENWQEIKKSVCRIIFKTGTHSTELCTGTLINNTARDGAAYIYTANHCIKLASQAESAVFYFGYEAESCNGPDPDEEGLLTNSIATSAVLATSDSLDFSLLLLSEVPPKSFEPVYAGWSRSEFPPQRSNVVHHPQGDVKKISADYDPALIEYQQDNPPKWLYKGSIPGAFWRIAEWDYGTTEGGSSGSPLFNEDKKIVGNLTGGDASCFNSVNDYFSKFFLNWDYYPEPNKQLKFWLDPNNNNPAELDLYNPYSDTSMPEIELFKIIPNPVQDDFVINTNDLEIRDVRIRVWNLNASLMADYFLEEAEEIRLSFSEFPPGIYILELNTGAFSERKKIVVVR